MQWTICANAPPTPASVSSFVAWRTPLAQKLSLSIEHRDAAIAIAVGNVDIAVGWIDDHAGGIEELRAAGVESLALRRSVRRVEDASLSDLQKQLPVVAPFLDDAVAVACQPDVVLVIDEAAVDDAGHCVRVAKGMNQVAGEIEDQNRRRLKGGLSLLSGDVTTVGDDEMIVRIGADAAGPADDPFVGQRLWPVGIDSECLGVLCGERS